MDLFSFPLSPSKHHLSLVCETIVGAVDAITGVLSRELGPKKIRVNTINPGVVETEGTHSGGVIGSDFEKAAIAPTPLGASAVFLASEDSAWLTGEQLLATGGLR